MTSYAKNMMMGPVLAPMTDKTKGSFGNKADCAGQNIKNNATAYLQSAGVAGTVVLGAKVASKKPGFASNVANKFASVTSKLLNEIACSKIGSRLAFQPTGAKTIGGVKGLGGKFVCENNKLGKILKNGAAAIMKHPKQALAAAGVAVAATALNFISRNHAYKAGQIDQKYTDRATAQKALNV